MRWTDTFEVVPQSEEADTVLRRLLDASASLWNQLTYQRRQQFFASGSVWDCDGYYDEYVDVLGSATAQQITRINDTAGVRSSKPEISLNRSRILPDTGEIVTTGGTSRRTSGTMPIRSTGVSAPVLRFPSVPSSKTSTASAGMNGSASQAGANPTGRENRGRLHLTYNDVAETYRAHQPVTVPENEQTKPTGTDIAALDIGANVLVACTTTAGDQYCYSGHEPFRQFRETTERIADAKAKLPEEQQTSRRIKRLYRKRSRRRDHAVNALLRDLIKRLYEDGVATIYHGDLTGSSVSTGRLRLISKRVPSERIGSISVSSRMSVKNTASRCKRSRKRGPPRRVPPVANANGLAGTARR